MDKIDRASVSNSHKEFSMHLRMTRPTIREKKKLCAARVIKSRVREQDLAYVEKISGTCICILEYSRIDYVVFVRCKKVSAFDRETSLLRGLSHNSGTTGPGMKYNNMKKRWYFTVGKFNFYLRAVLKIDVLQLKRQAYVSAPH